MRLFVALPLPSLAIEHLSAVQKALNQRAPCDVRWTAKEQLHLTLKFLGEVEDGRLPEMEEALDTVATSCAEITDSLQSLGCFPEHGRVRIAWAALADESGRIKSCAQQCIELFEILGFEREEREFHPHITIGRIKEDSSNGKLRALVTTQQFEPLKILFDSLELVSSVLTKSGPAYSVVKRVSLGAKT